MRWSPAHSLSFLPPVYRKCMGGGCPALIVSKPMEPIRNVGAQLVQPLKRERMLYVEVLRAGLGSCFPLYAQKRSSGDAPQGWHLGLDLFH